MKTKCDLRMKYIPNDAKLSRFTTISPLAVSKPNTVYYLMSYNNQLQVV